MASTRRRPTRGKRSKTQQPARGTAGRESTQAKRARVRRIIAILGRRYGNVGLALEFTTPLELLVALILAAQCTDARVNKVTAELFGRYRRPDDWAGLDRSTLESKVRPTGFYRSKARAIQDCCRALIDRFDGRVPETLEDLVSLPGVGRKTANILLGNAFGSPAIGVDTHVKRLAQRLGLSSQGDPDKIESELSPLVQDGEKVRFCHLLQAHGRAVCVAGTPKCPACAVNPLCPYPKQAGIELPAAR